MLNHNNMKSYLALIIVSCVIILSCTSNNKKSLEHFAKSKYFFDKEDYANASKENDTALFLDSTNLDIKILKACILANLNFNEDAILILKSILPEKFKSDTINYLIGRCYFESGYYYNSQKIEEEKEMDAYQNSVLYSDFALKINPQFYSAYISKYKSLHNLNKYDEAMVTINKAITIFPDSIYLRFGKGVTKHFLGDDFGAMIDISNAIQSNKLDSTDWSDAYRFRASIYIANDSIDLAIQDLTKAIIYNPKNEFSYYQRADLYRVKGLKEKACADFRKCADLGVITIYDTIRKYCDGLSVKTGKSIK